MRGHLGLLLAVEESEKREPGFRYVWNDVPNGSAG